MSHHHTRHTLLVLLTALLVASGCKSGFMPLREQGELSGKIHVIGNEPFTQLALKVDAQDQVVLLCPPDIEKYLREHQGQQARVTYDGISQVPEGQAVRVTLAEVQTE